MFKTKIEIVVNRNAAYSVSVVVPVYKIDNEQKLDFFEELLQSIRINCQAIDFFWIKELIIVDDSPGLSNKDGLLKALRKFEGICSCEYIENEKNGGQPFARNTGAQRASANYLHFIDQDDRLDVDFYKEINKQAPAKFDLIVGDCRCLSNPQVSFYKRHTKWWIAQKHNLKGIKPLLINNICNSPGQMVISRQKFWEINGFPNLVNRGSDDFAFFLRLISIPHSYCFIDDAKFLYRIHLGQASKVLDMGASEREAFESIKTDGEVGLRWVRLIKLSPMFMPLRVLIYKLLFNSFK